MKISRTVALGVALLITAPALAQDGGEAASGDEEIMTELAEAYDAVKRYGFEKKEEAVSWFGEQLDRLDAEIEELEGTAEAKWPEVVDEVEEQREAAAAQLERLRAASAAMWDGVKEGTADAMEELDRTVSEATSDAEGADEGDPAAQQ